MQSRGCCLLSVSLPAIMLSFTSWHLMWSQKERKKKVGGGGKECLGSMENVETRDSCIVCLNSPTERKPQNSESRVFFFFSAHNICQGFEEISGNQ